MCVFEFVCICVSEYVCAFALMRTNFAFVCVCVRACVYLCLSVG